MNDTYIKSPAGDLVYGFNWAPWLSAGETIVSAEWTVSDGIAAADQVASATTATIRVSGGELGQEYDLKCKITTSAGNVDERTMTIGIADRKIYRA